jgi:hypothetical protein
MRAQVLCGLVVVIGCGSDPTATEAAALQQSVPRMPPSIANVGAMFKPEMIASFDIPAFAITVDGTNLYWTMGADIASYTTPDWPIAMQCPKADCSNPTPLAYANPAASDGDSILPKNIAVTSTNVFFTSSVATNTSEIVTCSIGGCASSPSTVFSPSYLIEGFFAHDTDLIVGEPSAVGTCDATNCATTLSQIVAGSCTFVVDGDTLYWSDYQRLMSCPIAGCTTSTILAVIHNQSGRRIAVDAKNVYWEDANGLMKCNKTACSPTVLVPANELADSFDNDLMSDGQNLYFIKGARVAKCKVTGCNGKPTRVDDPYAPSDDSRYPNRLAMDDKYVYWTTGRTLTGTSGNTWLRSSGAIFRVAR